MHFPQPDKIEKKMCIRDRYSTHYSSIASSYSKADVVAQEYRAGGLVGCNTDNSTITDSLSHGDVEGNLNIGGLAGENAGAVSNSFATGGVNAATNAGGLAGYANGGSITGCYWNTETSGAVSYTHLFFKKLSLSFK